MWYQILSKSVFAMVVCIIAITANFSGPISSILGGEDPPLNLDPCDSTHIGAVSCLNGPGLFDECPADLSVQKCKVSASANTLFKLCGEEDGDENCYFIDEGCGYLHEDQILGQAPVACKQINKTIVVENSIAP
jgi:hypothetical protein